MRCACQLAPLLCALVAAALPCPVAGAPLVSGRVVVDDGGGVRYDGAPLGRLPLPPGKRSLRVSSPTAAGRALVRVIVRGAGGRAAELVAMPPGRSSARSPLPSTTPSTHGAHPSKREVLFAGSTGPQGVDGEWSRHVEADAAGVLLYQRREGVSRCDGAPIYLFPRMYDFKTHKLRPVARLERPGPLPELRAARAVANAPTSEPLTTFSLVFASTHAGDEQEAANLVAPVEAEDGKPETAWSEELGGSGQGELLIARAQPSPYRLKALRIIPGHAASAKSFAAANRIKSLLLYLGPTQRYRVIFPKDPVADRGKPQDPYWVILPDPVATTCATLVIEEVYAGTSAKPPDDGGRTAISELRFFTELDFGGGLAQLKRDLSSADRVRGESAVAVLARLERTGVELAAKLSASATGLLLRRCVQVLAQSRLGDATAPLAAALPRADRPTRKLALEALLRLPGAAAALATLLRDSSVAPALRVELARALGIVGGAAARAALLAQAGSGSDRERAAVVEGLGLLRDPDDLTTATEAAEQASEPRRRADLIHALGRLGARDGAATAGRLARLWATATDFEARYRLLGSIGRLDAGGQLPLLLGALRDADPIVRWMAAEQVRRAPAAAATAALRGATVDRDPRVRTTAALALGKRPTDRGVGADLARLLAAERWAMVAAAAAEALGHHCFPEGVAALRRAVSSGREAVDLRALHSLAQCRPAGLGGELLAIARGTTHRTALRTRALSLLSPDLARASAGALVRLVNELRRRAPTNDEDELVAASAVAALAAAGGAAAVEAAADALALDPHESIRAAGAHALGRLCPSSATEVMRRAAGDSSPAVQRAAKEALKRCRF